MDDTDQQEQKRAFAAEFDQHRSRLKQMLKFRMDPRLRSRVDVSDILQESYIEAFRRREHFDQQRGMSSYVWIRHVTMQRLIDLHRRHVLAGKRDVRQEVSQAEARFDPPPSAVIARQFVDRMCSPSQLVMRQELIEQLESTLEKLDPIDREILVLRHFEEMRNGEIAEVLELSEAAASNRYVRALTRLRKHLEQLPDFKDAP